LEIIIQITYLYAYPGHYLLYAYSAPGYIRHFYYLVTMLTKLLTHEHC